MSSRSLASTSEPAEKAWQLNLLTSHNRGLATNKPLTKGAVEVIHLKAATSHSLKDRLNLLQVSDSDSQARAMAALTASGQ